MNKSPHFIVIGGMKCMTSTLHEQLAKQPGISMSVPKEPCYFSDDELFAKGPDWYSNLWNDADANDLCGESSTHYTKLPTYPQTVRRIQERCPEAKLIYLMRDPIDRLVSQYVHEWTMGLVKVDINQAITELPILVDYSRYAYQLTPYYDQFSANQILPLFCSELKSNPQQVLEQVCEFIGYPGKPLWHHEIASQNVGAERMRKSKLRDAFVDAPVLGWIRKNLVPRSTREAVKSYWRMKRRPQLSDSNCARLADIFSADIAQLEQLLNRDLRGVVDFKCLDRSRSK